MGIRFACHQCGKSLNIKTNLAGKRGICPACSARFRIPLQDSPTSSPIEASPIKKTPVTAGPVAAESEATQSSQPQPKVVADDALADAPDATWYVRPPSGGQYGPADSALLREWIDQGRVTGNTLLWRDGWPQWREAKEAIAGLGSLGSTSENGLSAGSIANPGQTNRTSHSPQSPSASAQPSGERNEESLAADFQEQTISGRTDVGSKRRHRKMRNVWWICGLAFLAMVLLATLIYLLRG